MMENKELIDIKNFTLEFFKNDSAENYFEGNVFVVKKAPLDFEDFYEKKTPYYLVFNKNENGGEYVGPGSVLLKCMQDYMEKKGQTSLLKLEIEIDPIKEVSRRIKFGNCKIEHIIQKKDYNILKRFTFSTIYQYLNEKEKFLRSIYVDNGIIVDFDLGRYSSIEGKKEDVNIGAIKKDYNVAKEELKKSLSRITEDIGKKIEDKLEKEISRIKEHYAKQISEKNERAGNIQKQIKKIEEQIAKAPENDKKPFDEKIERLKGDISDIETSDNVDRIKKEEEFLINDEIRKHGLNISNKLINTTIIYYPSFLLQVILINSKSKGHFDIKFNPHSQLMTLPVCRSCKREIMEVYLCSSEHASCKLCLMKCLCCSKEYCKMCVDKKCSSCFRDICKKCYTRCQACGKGLCEMHTRKIDSVKSACIACTTQCMGCNKIGLKKHFIKCPSCGSEACNVCSKKILVKVGPKINCPRCSKKCDACKKPYPNSEFYRLKSCECDSCNSLVRCLSCKKFLCKKVRKQF